MIKSILRYSREILKIIFRGRSRYLLRETMRLWHKKKAWQSLDPATRDQAADGLAASAGWLITAQKMMKDNGIGSYTLSGAWSSSYPETTGYIIPTLLDYYRFSKQEEARTAALQAAAWLVSIQLDNGGWQGGRMNENRPAIVFNTGQVLRGLVAAWEETRLEEYLDCAIRGADWLCDVQHPDGYWKKHALMNQARVYDAYVDVPLLNLWKITGNQRYADHARRNLEWITRKKQLGNGWFSDCDNTVKHNDRPILHTIAYTIDGLHDCGTILGNKEFLEAAAYPAEMLAGIYKSQGFLHGRYDEKWNGSEHPILTGMAQMAIIWQKMAGKSSEGDYKNLAGKLLSQLLWLQEKKGSEDMRGAITGSFPLWGRYEPFAYPNWAVKFFSDALLLYCLQPE